jgi:hypothetical protein
VKTRAAKLSKANDMVSNLHRHHKPVRGHKFSIFAVGPFGECGVVIVGRPVARMTNQETHVEVTRLATDGTKNACSFLYSAAARAADALGYEEIQTFILESEPGTSLRAAGWECMGPTRGGDWNRPSRGNRRTDQPVEPKIKWRKLLSAALRPAHTQPKST